MSDHVFALLVLKTKYRIVHNISKSNPFVEQLHSVTFTFVTAELDVLNDL